MSAAANHPFRPFRSTVQLRGNDAVGKEVFVDRSFSAEDCDRVLALASAQTEQAGRTGEEGKIDEARSSHIRFLWPEADNAWLFTRLEEAAMRLNQSYGFDLTGFYEGRRLRLCARRALRLARGSRPAAAVGTQA